MLQDPLRQPFVAYRYLPFSSLQADSVMLQNQLPQPFVSSSNLPLLIVTGGFGRVPGPTPPPDATGSVRAHAAYIRAPLRRRSAVAVAACLRARRLPGIQQYILPTYIGNQRYILPTYIGNQRYILPTYIGNQ